MTSSLPPSERLLAVLDQNRVDTLENLLMADAPGSATEFRLLHREEPVAVVKHVVSVPGHQMLEVIQIGAEAVFELPRLAVFLDPLFLHCVDRAAVWGESVGGLE